jgi:long-chain fatty acid transport protein
MNCCFRAKIAALSFVAISGIFSAGFCGGIWLYENGTPETGTAGVGYPARAQDAATVYGNPAGMTRLNGLNYLGGMPIASQTIQFSVDSATFGGGGDGNAGGTRLSYGLYYENQPLPKSFPGLRTGFNTNSYVDEILDYADTWAGRFYTQKTELQTLHSSTSAAYPITPWFSIGAGFNTIYGKLKQHAAVNNGPDSTNGQISVEAYNMSAGGNAGVLFLPLPNLRFGVTYRSPINLRFRSALGITNVNFALLDTLVRTGAVGKTYHLDIRVPQEVAAGFYMDLTNQIAIMADWNWQDWSNFRQFEFQVPTGSTSSLVSKPKLKDTYHVGVGFHFRPFQPLTLMTGFSWDSSPISDSSRTPNFPVDRQFRYAGGIEYFITDWFNVGGSYEYIGLGNAPIDQIRGPLVGTLAGHYSTNRVNVFNLYAKGRF